MKIIITGSLGYTGKPLAEKLVNKGHAVTVVSSTAARQKDIEDLGAKAAIGSMQDALFLTETFRGADAVYCLLAPYGDFTDPNNDAAAIIKQAQEIAESYSQAIKESGIKRVVYLSSIGAEMTEGSGLIIVHHNAENTLNKLPSDVNISFIRPSGFYKNLFGYANSIKNGKMIAASYGGDDRNVFVSAADIADAAVEELESKAAGRKVRYVASDQMTCGEAASILGAAVGKPDLKWVKISDEQQLNDLKAHGMNDSIARSFAEMNAGIRDGKFYEEYDRHKPALGKIKLEDFAKEFAMAYNQK